MFVHHADVEDLALTFVEEELGRYDWRNNWQRAKQAGNLRQRIIDWLNLIGTRHVDPDEIIDVVDRLVVERAGRWG